MKLFVLIVLILALIRMVGTFPHDKESDGATKAGILILIALVVAAILVMSYLPE